MAKAKETPEPAEDSGSENAERTEKPEQAEAERVEKVKRGENATDVQETESTQGQGKTDYNWGMLCHLAGLVPILGPLLIWLLKKDEDPFADEQGKHALNFGISVLIYGVVLCLTIIGIPFLPVLGIVYVIFLVVGAAKASDGKSYRYPIAIRFIK